MSEGGPPGDRVLYQRARFTTHLPSDRRYTPDHHWLLEDAPGVWRVGLTRFGLRLLGDIVEGECRVPVAEPVGIGQEVGTIEGFKAATSLCSAVDGEFLGAGAALVEDITLVETEPYDRGWLYRVRGTPDPASVDVHAYMSILDGAIDAVLRRQRAAGDDESRD